MDIENNKKNNNGNNNDMGMEIESKHPVIKKEGVDNLKIANDYKKKGVAFFREKNYKRAQAMFSKIFLYVNAIAPVGGDVAAMVPNSSPDITEEQKLEVKKLQESSYLNISACRYELKQFDKAVEYADKALQVNEKSAKAYFRKGKAHYAKKSWYDAVENFEKALQLQPGEQGMQKWLSNSQKQKDKQNKDQFKGLGKAFKKGFN